MRFKNPPLELRYFHVIGNFGIFQLLDIFLPPLEVASFPVFFFGGGEQTADGSGFHGDWGESWLDEV